MTKFLQEKLLPVSDGIDVFEIALNQEPGSGFEDIGLNPSYLNLTNRVVEDLEFLKGVSKLQKDEAHSLTEPEKLAVARLRSSPVVIVHGDEELAGEDNSRGSLGRALKKRRAAPPAEYINCSFILATAIDVERLWSLAKNVLTDKRRGMATRMVQAILFLKENRDLWTEAMVYDSILAVKRRNTSRRTRQAEEATCN